MNIANIKATIAAIEYTQNLNMNAWQDVGDKLEPARTLEEIHACGNSACIAGYAGLTKEFQSSECKTYIDSDGEPRVEVAPHIYEYGVGAFARFVDIPYSIAKAITLNSESTVRIERLIGKHWHDWDWKDAITVLNKLIDGTIANEFCISMEKFHYERY